MNIKEIHCKTALSKSALPGYDYALNPYRGCSHACVYCYAPAVLRERREWGSFVDVKVNMPLVLSKELRKKKRGVVGISTVTDGYQQIEKKYEATRRCLEQLLRFDFPISIQTKSSLVLRDLDLIQQFSQRDIGITITTIDEEARKKYEPSSSPVEERLSALEEIAKEGIETWVFIGPVMPYITDKNEELATLIKELARANVGKIMIDKLRMKPGLEEKISSFLSEYYPELMPKYKRLDEGYFQGVKSKIVRLCKEQEVKYECCF